MHIKLTTDDYTIVDIENVTIADETDIEEILLTQLTENIYPEITFNIEELKEHEYIVTNDEKKESFIYEMIKSYNIYSTLLLITIFQK